jgi:hypothetical protein
MTATRTVIARNPAEASENKIHSDDVARTYGFRGGLVPGVTSYAYVVDAVVDHHGLGWVGGGRLDIRLLHPVYAGDAIVASCADDGAVSLVGPDGVNCVAGVAGTDPIVRGKVPAIDAAPLPRTSERPPADDTTLAPGVALGTLSHSITPEAQQGFFNSIGIDEPRWAEHGFVHPGMLILDANSVLVRNVVLGPWIHVGSDVSLLSPVAFNRPLEVRSRVSARYERKGHQFVELDVVTAMDGVAVCFVHHTAIYEPRLGT